MTRPWLVLGAVAVANLVVAALHFGLAAAGPLLRSELGLGTAMLGAVLAAPAIGLMLGTFGWGVLADRTSERRVLTGAFAGFAVATLVGAQRAAEQDVTGFAAAMLVSGLMGSAAHSAGGRAISAAFAPDRHGLVLSIRHVAIPVGAALGGVVMPAMIVARDLGSAVGAAAGAGVGAAALLAWLVPSSRSLDARRRRELAPQAGRSPLRLPAMWLLAVGGSSLAFVQLGIGSFLTVQLVDRGGTTIGVAAVVFTAAQLLGGAGRVVLGFASDRARERVDVLLRVAVVALAFVGAGLLVPSPLVAALLQAAALVVVTSCNGVVVAVASSLAPPGRTGATLGMQTTANAAACALAPIMLGVVLAGVGWTAAGAVLVVALLVSSAALVRLRAIRRRSEHLAAAAGSRGAST
jgi:MFS family permease